MAAATPDVPALPAFADGRLPTAVKPTAYAVSLDVQHAFAAPFEYKAVVTITAKVYDATPWFMVNVGKALVIDSVAFSAAGEKWTPVGMQRCDEDDINGWFFDKPLPEDAEVVATINITAEMKAALAGFYRATYDVDGEQHLMGLTQFEAVDARNALPCFDQPEFKAKFTVDITAPAKYIVLNNMPLENEGEGATDVDGGAAKKWQFATTPIMSSYLLAWVIGEFDHIEKKSHGGVTVRVFLPKGRNLDGRFALDIAAGALDVYADFFGTPYPLPKCDHVAAVDFAAGAMENWGLVTYRETALSLDEHASIDAKRRVAEVVAHENAHNWFGNLVTMKWWTDLWLNEGFATWAAVYCVERLDPSLGARVEMVSDILHPALNLDALRSSHPIEVTIHKAAEVDAIFDAISYLKGCSVIQMLYAWLGEEAFRNGMRAYVAKYAYQNTVTVDLWECLSEASGQPVGEVMSHFTKQVGFPLVSASYDAGTKEIVLDQQRFFKLGPDASDESLWDIPLAITVNDKQLPACVMKG